MGYRKFQGDYLFNGYEMLSSAVLITDLSGVIQAVCSAEEAGDGIEKLIGLITPGFVNTHCHLELSHMKGKVPPGTGLVEFLIRVIKERNYPATLIANAMDQAAAEMYEGGIVAVGDVCNTADSISAKTKTNICWHNFIEVLGFTQDKAPERFAHAEKVLHAFLTAAPSSPADCAKPEQVSPCNHASLSPHAPYSVSGALFKLINDASEGKPVTIHNQETTAENDLYRYNTGQLFDLYSNLNIDASSFQASGKNSLQTYLPWLDKASGTILVHNTCTQEEDIAFVRSLARNTGLFFCVCINANRYIASANPPVELLRKNDCIITIGTDSYASNWQLSILEEIKTLQQVFSVPLPEMLQWATRNGAKALQMDKKLGSFEAGKQPGVVLINNIINGAVAADASAKRLL